MLYKTLPNVATLETKRNWAKLAFARNSGIVTENVLQVSYWLFLFPCSQKHESQKSLRKLTRPSFLLVFSRRHDFHLPFPLILKNRCQFFRGWCSYDGKSGCWRHLLLKMLLPFSCISLFTSQFVFQFSVSDLQKNCTISGFVGALASEQNNTIRQCLKGKVELG